MHDTNATDARDMDPELLADALGPQRTGIEGYRHEADTVLVMFSDYPTIQKPQTDALARRGARISGLTQDPDGTVNVFLRPLTEGAVGE